MKTQLSEICTFKEKQKERDKLTTCRSIDNFFFKEKRALICGFILAFVVEITLFLSRSITVLTVIDKMWRVLQLINH